MHFDYDTPGWIETCGRPLLFSYIYTGFRIHSVLSRREWFVVCGVWGEDGLVGCEDFDSEAMLSPCCLLEQGSDAFWLDNSRSAQTIVNFTQLSLCLL